MFEATQHYQTVTVEFLASGWSTDWHVQTPLCSPATQLNYSGNVCHSSGSLFDQDITSGWGNDILGLYNESHSDG